MTARNHRSTVAAWCTAVLLAGICLAVWPRGFLYPNYAGAILFQGCVLFLALVWAFPAKSSVPTSTRVSTGIILLSAYGLFTLCSCFQADSPRLAYIGSIQVMFPVAWALLLGRTLRTPQHFRLLLRVIVIAGVVAAVAALYYIAQSRHRDALQMVLGHRNFLAIFLLPPILLCIADVYSRFLRRSEETKSLAHGIVTGWPWPVSLGCGGLMLAVMLLCGAIGAALGLAFGLACLLTWRWVGRRHRLAVGLIVACVLVAIIIMSQPGVEARMAPRAQLQRWFLWKGAVRMFAERPVTGWGVGMFLPHFQLFKPPAPMRYGILNQLTLHPHNELLLIAIEGGLVGLALYLGGIFALLRAFLRRTAGNADPLQRLMIWALFAGFAAMSVQGLVTVSLRYWGPPAMYWTLIGMMLAYPNLTAKPKPATTAPTRIGISRPLLFAGVILGVILVLINIVGPGLKAEWLLNGAYGTMTRADGKRIRCRKVWAWPFGFENRPATSTEHTQDLRHAQRLSRYLPDYFQTLVKQGDFHRSQRNYPAALKAYEQLEKEAPGYSAVRRVLAEVCYQQAQTMSDAESQWPWLERAVKWYGLAIAQNPYDYRARLDVSGILIQASARNLPQVLAHLRVVADAPQTKQYNRYRKRALELIALADRRIGRKEMDTMAQVQELEDRLQTGLVNGK